jgi:hypothetical protein
MDKAIEIVRRLLQAIIWVVGGCATAISVAAYFTATGGDIDIFFPLAAAGVTIALSKLVNWILLKDE